MSKNFFSPLRYPGGKSKLAPYFTELIKINHLVGGHYYEPYAGGAGLALDLLFNEIVSEIHLNDLNKSIFAFWNAIINFPKEFCELVMVSPVTVDEWHRQKEIQNSAAERSFELGFSTFFLNRTNVSGVIKGGMIGGNKQTGNYKIDARFNRIDLVNRIRRISMFKSRINLYNQDAYIFLTETLPKLPLDGLVYLDPPYYVKGQHLYDNHYKSKDHSTISEVVQNKIKQKWVVSYDDVIEITDLYSLKRCIPFDILYSAKGPSNGKELLFIDDTLQIPEKLKPLKLTPKLKELSLI